MTAVQKLVLVVGVLWGVIVTTLFIMKGLSGSFNPVAFTLFWSVPTLIVWLPTGVLKFVVAWFKKA